MDPQGWLNALGGQDQGGDGDDFLSELDSERGDPMLELSGAQEAEGLAQGSGLTTASPASSSSSMVRGDQA